MPPGTNGTNGINIGSMFVPKRFEVESKNVNDPRDKMLKNLQELGVSVPNYSEPIKTIDGDKVKAPENQGGAKKVKEQKEGATTLRLKIT